MEVIIMDYKQHKILDNIYKHFHITGKKKTFVQHRNLKEFRFFSIERLNPNHRIRLYGQLKRSQVKDGHHNTFINVGEIIISISLLMFVYNPFFLDLLISIAFYIFLIHLFDDIEILKELKTFADWNRGESWKWKNSSCS